MTETLNIPIKRIAQSKIDKVDFNNIQFGKTYSDHMFTAEYKDGEWKNCQIEPYELMQISPASPALHYGVSIFEGMKAFKNEKGEISVFRADKNYERLNISANRMCMPQLPSEIFFEGLNTLLELDKNWIPDVDGTSLYIRPFMFSNDDYIGIRPSQTFKFMIITCPVGAYYAKPVKVKIEHHFVRAVEGGSGYCKTGCNYGPAIYPAKLAQDKGYDQLVWTDGKEHKYIEESGTMNIMFVIDNKLITPSLGDTILSGITRDSVLTIARDWGMDVEERKVEVAEVVTAARAGKLQEAFGAGTAATIAHIDLIGYLEEDFQLPPVEGRKFSNRVLKELDDIKLGRVEDRFNWISKL
jgi:branched-chain amino acid aminotransferase